MTRTRPAKLHTPERAGLFLVLALVACGREAEKAVATRQALAQAAPAFADGVGEQPIELRVLGEEARGPVRSVEFEIRNTTDEKHIVTLAVAVSVPNRKPSTIRLGAREVAAKGVERGSIDLPTLPIRSTVLSTEVQLFARYDREQPDWAGSPGSTRTVTALAYASPVYLTFDDAFGTAVARTEMEQVRRNGTLLHDRAALRGIRTKFEATATQSAAIVNGVDDTYGMVVDLPRGQTPKGGLR